MAADVNQKTIAELIVSKNPSLSKKAATEIIELIFDEISRTVKADKKVDISGFGKFVLKQSKAREGINPATKEKIQIPAKKKPAFRAAKAFKEFVK